MSFKNIERRSTSEMVINQIKNEIKNGDLKEGEKLPSERELGEMLGVSRTSIREAIQALSFAGYLESFQGRGTYVAKNAKKYDEISELLAKVSDYSLASLMEVREMLEGEFVRLATLRATDDEIESICAAFQAMKDAENVREFVREDLNFHLCIASASHNPLMNTLMKVFGEMLHKETNHIVEQSVETQNQTLEVTQKLVEAIKRRDEIEAKKLMVEHVKIIEEAIK
ncbi:MAG: FadR/GntR family transcriptional regulator [Bacillota bacterium]